MSKRELIEKEVATLPEALQREVFDFARFLRLNPVRPALLLHEDH